jgi:hypothetical protein
MQKELKHPKMSDMLRDDVFCCCKCSRTFEGSPSSSDAGDFALCEQCSSMKLKNENR